MGTGLLDGADAIFNKIFDICTSSDSEFNERKVIPSGSYVQKTYTLTGNNSRVDGNIIRMRRSTVSGNNTSDLELINNNPDNPTYYDYISKGYSYA